MATKMAASIFKWLLVKSFMWWKRDFSVKINIFGDKECDGTKDTYIALPGNQNGGQNGGQFLQMALSEVLSVLETWFWSLN